MGLSDKILSLLTCHCTFIQRRLEPRPFVVLRPEARDEQSDWRARQKPPGWIAKGGVRPCRIGILYPFSDGAAGMVEAEEQALSVTFPGTSHMAMLDRGTEAVAALVADAMH